MFGLVFPIHPVDMSITNGAFEPLEGEQPSKESLYQKVQKFICDLAFPHGEILSDHAAHKAHEDVPDDEVLPADGACFPSWFYTHTIFCLPMNYFIYLSASILETQLGRHVILHHFPFTLQPHTSARLIPFPVENVVRPFSPPRRLETKAPPERLRSLIPPANFGAVVPGSIYRSSYPQEENYEFLESLKLKTILTLVPEQVSFDYLNFMAQSDIQHFQVHIPANKGEVNIQSIQMSNALRYVLDRSNHPILIHCNKGKHRTGCVVGCFRRVTGEELDNIFEEYHTYADPKARLLDECFIERYPEETLSWMARKYEWIPPAVEAPPPSPVQALNVAAPPRA
ncbi:hypothetical protein CC78DRAFT_121044 [Lojkania enalia]|uniref:diphosphoinositol-polyphosphate diphosphatase n=1 Tax=Lojkania enalia TaxID=147567 RepID=A0A9P4N1Y6_9PLEO|nr:hypothetical protein CC78DRAFT_121044 [Didymosphaeria enalia]